MIWLKANEHIFATEISRLIFVNEINEINYFYFQLCFLFCLIGFLYFTKDLLDY